jgi:excisionase family DNA binding protein
VDLSLPEAAALLGQSLHQVRYLIRTARLPAKKVSGQWRVRREDLPRGEAQAQAADRKVERLREAVDDAPAPSSRGETNQVGVDSSGRT